MKLTNIEIVNIINILEQYSEKKLPQKISYAITKNILILKEDYLCYEKELNKIFDIYDADLQKDEEGKLIRSENGIPLLKKGSNNSFVKDVTELLNITVDINLYKINSELFDYIDVENRYDPLSPKDIIVLQDVLC